HPFAIEGTIDHISRVGERGRKLPVEIGIVLDHEETQGQCSHRCDTPESALAAVTLPLHKKRGKVEEDPGGGATGLAEGATRAFAASTSPSSFPVRHSDTIAAAKRGLFLLDAFSPC